MRIDLNKRTANILISEAEYALRQRDLKLPEPVNQTPWQELHRQNTGQLSTGMVFEMAVKYQKIAQTFDPPRDNH